MKILFINLPYHGHVIPTIGLVQELIKAGHQVTYLTEGGDEGSTVLPGDEDIAVQTLFVDELGNLLDTVEFRGFTAAYTQKCGMGVYPLGCGFKFHRVEFTLDLVIRDDSVIVARVPEVDMKIAVLSFDGALLETLTQTVRVLTADPFFHGANFLFGERLRCRDLHLTVEGGADTCQPPFTGQELTADGIVDLLIVRPEVHRHGVDIPLLICKWS